VADARFLRQVLLQLELARQASVRSAIHDADVALRGGRRQDSSRRRAVLAAVGELARPLADRVFVHREEVLRDFARLNEIDQMRGDLSGILGEACRRSDATIAAVAISLCERHMGGNDVSDDLAVAAGGIVREEDFPRMLLDAAAAARPLTYAERRLAGASNIELLTGWAVDAVPDMRATGAGTLEAVTRSLMYVTHVLVEAATQEHEDLFSRRLDTATVVRTRGQIQRYARDMSFNVAVIIVVMLALLAAVAAKL
jgi:hypothetical protein